MKNFKTLSKRGLALFLALMMCVSLLPATAMAAELNDLSADGRELICGKEAHSHTEECYETVSDLICGMEENHVHGEDCYVPGEPVLACASDEEGHVHTDACYVPGERVLRCGTAEDHVHSGDCYTESKSETLICALEEHEHSEECYAPAEEDSSDEIPEAVQVFLDAAGLIPEEITADNADAAQAQVDAALLAYESLTAEESAREDVAASYQIVLDASVAIEEVRKPRIPEGATVVDPAWLLAANPNAGKAVLSAWNLFGLVRDNYQDVLGGNFPETLTFVGETVNETVWYEDTQEYDPAVIHVTGDAIIYNGEPVTVYFQGMIEGVDEPELLKNSTLELPVGEQRVLTKTGSKSYDQYQWKFESGENCVTLSPTNGESTTVTGTAAGEAIVKLQGKSTWSWSWIDIDKFNITVTNSSKNEVVFDLNGGTGTVPSAISFNNAGDIVEPLPSQEGFSRQGYKFLGWATKQDANTVVDGTDGIKKPHTAIYAAGGAFETSRAGTTTLYAVWAKNDGYLFGTVRIALRMDGNVPSEPSIQEAEYTFLPDITDNVLTYVNPAHTVAGVTEVNQALTDDFHQYVATHISDVIPGYNSDTQYIEWYVIKYQGRDSVWHIDGVIRERSKVNLDYDKNGSDVSGLAPTGKQYTQGTTATVEDAYTMRRPGYTFAGWNTAADGSGTVYRPGNTITMDESVTLYAQWEIKNGLPYTVNYYLEDTETELADSYHGTARFGSQITINTPGVKKDITGYTYVSSTPEELTIGEDVERNVINLYYKVDTDQTQDTKYTVQHVVEGEAEPRFTQDYTGTAWILDNPAQIAIEAGSLDQKTISGYKFKAIDNDAKVGDKVNSGTVITLTYEKDESQTRSTEYTVKYMIEGVVQTNDDIIVNGTAWINDDPAKIAIAEGGIPAPTDKYAGYKLDEANPAYPAAGTEVVSGTEYTVNYVKRTDLTFTVNYYLEGTTTKVADSRTVENQTFGTEVTENAIAVPNYVVEGVRTQTITIGVENNVINFYYTADRIGPNGGPDGTPDKYQATVTFTVVNGTWTGGGTTRSTVVTLRNAAGEMAADGTYTLRTGDIPTGTANAGYANGVWGANANPNGAVIDRRGASYELTYAPAGTTGPVFPPPDPGPGTGGGTTTIPENPTPLGPDPDGATTILDEEVPLANAVGLNITEHFAYIIGYEDDTVRPLKNITRAEAVTIFFRLMEDDYRAANWSMENPFSDVNAGNWHNNAVSTCLKAGALKHFAQDAAFLPNQAITRAEFASIAAGFVSDEITGESIGDFSDTEGHWAAADIRKAVEAGWIKGVGGNRFAPDETITRAEVMTIVNRMLDRVPDAEHMLPDMKKWLDNPEDAWYYEAVQEATNEHDYDVDEFGAESWTEILEARDWKSLENEWANNGGMSASAEPVKPEEGAEGEGEAEDAGSESEEA